MSTTVAYSPNDTEPRSPRTMSPRRLARVTGVMYVVLVGLGLMGPLTLETLLVPGDAGATAANLADSSTAFTLSLGAWVVIVAVDVAISVTLFLLLAPVSRGLSILAAAFRLVYSTALAALLVHLFLGHQLLTPTGSAGPSAERQALAALETFSAGFLVALVFFGVHLVLLGALFYRSRYVPRILGDLLVAAGIGYVVDSLASLMVDGYGGYVAALLLTPAVLGEVGLTLWLLVKGVTTGSR
jgi:hypothetical protein